MNIFFIGSIRGGRANQPRYAQIVQALGQFGAVSSQFVSDGTLSQYGETNLPDREIFERELQQLSGSDLVVAEVTTSSLGVGYLIASAVTQGKRVIALYDGADTLTLSAMIQGNPQIRVYTYKTDADIQKIFTEVFG